MQWLTDKDGNRFQLDDETWAHIQEFHPEIENYDIVQEILTAPDIIVASNWDPASILYYKRISLRRFRVVVVHVVERRIKTTLTTDKVKRGIIVWQKEKTTD